MIINDLYKRTTGNNKIGHNIYSNNGECLNYKKPFFLVQFVKKGQEC